jgi:hypothetical protein
MPLAAHGEIITGTITLIEWIWERSDRLWHNATTPRILQADEAINYLRFFADRAAKKWPLRGSLKLG